MEGRHELLIPSKETRRRGGRRCLRFGRRRRGCRVRGGRPECEINQSVSHQLSSKPQLIDLYLISVLLSTN